MDVRHLTLLHELAERGSIVAVAAATHRTPSAVSQQLRTASREFGVDLVEPHGRGVRLTDAGRMLAGEAVAVQERLAEVEARLAEFVGSPSGVVRIAALASAAEYLLPATCLALAGGGIEIHLDDIDVAEEDYARVAADYDIVIGHSLTGEVLPGSAHLTRSVVAREPIDVALPSDHRLAEARAIRAIDVVDDPWIGVPVGFPFDEVLRGIELSTGREAHRLQRVRDNRLVESFVAAGLGVGLLPRFTTRERPDLVLRPLVDVPATRWIVALSRPDRARRAVVRRVRDTLTRVARHPDPPPRPA